MATYASLLFCYISTILILTGSLWCGATNEDRQVYIVYMGFLPDGEYSPSSHHLSILEEVVGGSSPTDNLIRSYKRSFNGFAANLTDQEKQRLASMEGVVSVFPRRTLQLHTTRSWDFMGFPENVHRNPSIESDIIVGVIDSGIWPESESFNDKGFGPAPKKWKGACKGGVNFTCNNKIIGAQYYPLSDPTDESARDIEGHGTHTASTAAGNNVKDASFYGVAQGTARGGVPSARIAAYKVCHPEGCQSDYILAAFDDAIADGVDIITVSLGGSYAAGFDQDAIAIGAFHAMEKGILTTQSAGNSGPEGGTVASVAPWLLTVAASNTDRKIIDKVVLGDGKTLDGSTINSFTLNGTKFPLIYGKDVTSQCDESSAESCISGCLDSNLVKGKIVLCDNDLGGKEAFRAGALGSIVRNDGFSGISFISPLPASDLAIGNYNLVKSYFNSTKRPQGTILKSEATKDLLAPVVASFSSRGPNGITPDILKPDVTAPGVDILAAFSPVVSPSGNPDDKRSVKYSILSGTSMSCPHVAAAAAYVKTFHPNWSPSAIKSALMTTAWTMNATANDGAEFSYGSGHINLTKAVDPGLVYEVYKEDYINFLCGIGYNVEKLRIISGDNITCPKEKTLPRDLNYPSFAVQVPRNKAFKISFHRTVTNVGLPNSTYTAKVSPSSNIKIEVVPRTLSFKSLKEKKSFVVTVVGGALPSETLVSLSLVWSTGTHNVRSPIIVYTNTILGENLKAV